MRESTLRRVPLFAMLPDREIRFLAESLRSLQIPGDTILFREGERGDRFYIILDGQVEIVKALGTGDERLVDVQGAGGYFGEMSLLNPDERRTATVRARTRAELLEMTRAEFDELLHRQPRLTFEMMRVLSLRLSQAHDRTIADLQEKNRVITQAYRDLQAAQQQLVEKEKLEHELELARRIQESMLPRTLPRLEGFDFSARMVPARAVGGDLFDFIPLEGERLCIVVGDVTDKGVPAAMFMALTRSLVRAEASRTDSPVQVLRNVNRHLLAMNEQGLFVTMLCGVLHGATREFHYVRAGHESPILVNGPAEPTLLPHGRGQPLGIFDQPALDEQRVTCAPGATLVLFTDGVTEATNGSGEFFGLENFCHALRTHSREPARELCDGLVDAVTAFRGNAAQSDDITIVAISGSSI